MRWIFRALLVTMLLGTPVSTAFGQQERGPIEKALFPDVKAGAGTAGSGMAGSASESVLAARRLAMAPDARKEVSRVETPRTTHVTYRQMFAGLPVVGRWARVSTDPEGRVRFVSSGFAESEKKDHDFNTVPAVTAFRAEQAALGSVAPGGGKTGDAELSVFIPGAGGSAVGVGSAGEPTLVWEVLVWPDDEPAEWHVIVEARTGRVLMAQDRALRHKPKAVHEGAEGSRGSAVDGVGTVFDPNPLVTSGAMYGAPWVDGFDATNAFLDGELQEVILRDLTTNSEGKYVLEGPYVRIDGSQTGGGMPYTPPALSNPANFRYNRSDEHFEAVMAYYHLDANQRYLQSLGFMDLQNAPLPVHPRALTRDDSFYLPSLNRLLFGLGGVDDAEDATVLWHEYAHAMLEAAAPGLSATLEGIAVHEGWSDYWAASQARALVESGAAARQDWRRLFKWDSGDGSLWAGRTMDHFGTYPADTCSDNRSPGACSPHNDGRLWATTLMEVQDVLGRDVTDRLVLHSHAYLTAPLTFAEAAEAVLQANMDFFDAEHVGVLLSIFDPRGLVDASLWGPVLLHDPVPNTPIGIETVDVVLDVIAGTSAPASVVLFATGTHTGNQEITMAEDGSGTYRAVLSLPSEPDTIFYWFRVTDVDGVVTTLPETAPDERFSFVLGADLTPPVIQHVPIASGNVASWPEVVSATVTDLFGVDRVEIVHSIVSAVGEPLASGTFALTQNGTTWSGAFPVSFSEIQKDAVVTYRLIAWDKATDPNSAETPWYSFTIQASDLLREIDLTGPDVSITGAWAIQVPGSATDAVPGSGPVASWRYDTAASPTAGVHELSIPSIRLDRVEQAWLTYWYRVDAEASGPIDPLAGGSGQAFDALLVQIRADNGVWSTSAPETGYPTVVAGGTGNPLGGSPSFGGSTYGWRFAAHPLPVGSAVKVQFVIGSDNGNSEPVPDGFRVTDVRFWSDLPLDVVPPEITAVTVPEEIGIRDDSVQLPDISIVARDVSGVTDVFMDVRQGSGAMITYRMRQDRTSLTGYSAPLMLMAEIEPGQTVDIRFRVLDAWGNETVLPLSGGWFSATVVLQREQDLLDSAVAFSGWRETQGWSVTALDVTGDRASLNIAPLQIPSNGSAVELRLAHSYHFPSGSGSGGVVQISTDDGSNWSVLTPNGDYPGLMYLSGAHGLSGTKGYRGSASDHVDVFDLSAFMGEQVWVRFLYVQERDGVSTEADWRVGALTLVSETEEEAFDVPMVFALHAAYPNPFRTRAEITWSLDEDSDARIAVYDVLGRLVTVVDEGYMPSGSHRGTLDGAGLASGVYVVRLEAAGRFVTRTIVRQ